MMNFQSGYIKFKRDLLVFDKKGIKYLLPSASFVGPVPVENVQVRLNGIDFTFDGKEFVDLDNKQVEFFRQQDLVD